MRVRGLRGVVIGIDRALMPGDIADLDAAQVAYLESIGAAERVLDEEPAAPAAAESDPISQTRPARAGKREK